MKYSLINDQEKLALMFPTVAKVFNCDYLENLKPGKTMINDSEYCIRTGYNMRPVRDQFFESHQKYIDIHITLNGVELFAVTNIKDLIQSSDYDSEGDCFIYNANSPIQKLVSNPPHSVIVFDFGDGHMTAIGDEADTVEKVIVKVLVENFNN